MENIMECQVSRGYFSWTSYVAWTMHNNFQWMLNFGIKKACNEECIPWVSK